MKLRSFMVGSHVVLRYRKYAGSAAAAPVTIVIPAGTPAPCYRPAAGPACGLEYAGVQRLGEQPRTLGFLHLFGFTCFPFLKGSPSWPCRTALPTRRTASSPASPSPRPASPPLASPAPWPMPP